MTTFTLELTDRMFVQLLPDFQVDTYPYMAVVDITRISLYNLRTSKELNITGTFDSNKVNRQFFKIEQGLTQFRRNRHGHVELIVIAVTKVLLENGVASEREGY